jgi:shikimate kinase
MKTDLNPKDRNVILIGMCGVGKSTVGVILAKMMSRYFLDSDVFIQAIQDRDLQHIIDTEGLAAFCKIEEEYVTCIDVKNAVIATGGSVVYSPQAMRHLASTGIIIHLDLDFETIANRVTNLYARGVVMEKGQSLESLYEKRQPLYQQYAQLTVDCAEKNHEQIAEEIITLLS